MRANMNRAYDNLVRILAVEEGPIYAYVLSTIHYENGRFAQAGSAPNFQGGYITLCTCKHRMRTYMEPEDWKNVWIAGFTGKNTVGDGRNHLIYLMRVSDSFSSHKEIWVSVSEGTRKAKNARTNRYGDLYEPKPNLRNEFEHSNYYSPVTNHVHAEGDKWHEDILYEGVKGRKPALVQGDSGLSFLWSKPDIHSSQQIPRTKRFDDMGKLLQILAGK